MKNIILTFLKRLAMLGLGFMPLILNAQGFVEPLESGQPITHFPAILVDNEGREIRGKMMGGHISNGYIKWVKIKSQEGEKVKLNGELVKSLKVKAGKLVKLTMFIESTASVKKMVNTDYNEIVEKEYFIFEQILMPKKKDKYALVQLLNPGFDSKIKVYVNPDPNVRKTLGVGVLTGGIKVTGGEERSYLFVKNKEKAIVVKKGKYRKDFFELYGDCEQMIKTFGGQKTKFKDMAEHVFVYDQVCN